MVALWETTSTHSPGCAVTISRTTGSAREHRDARLAPRGREGERVLLPRRVLVRVSLLDLAPREPLPPPVADLAQLVAQLHLHPARLGDEPRGLARAGHGAAVRRRDPLVVQPRAEQRRLPPPLVRELDADGAGEAVLGRELRGAVADEEEAGHRHKGVGSGE